VSFINNLTNAGRKADLQQRLEEGEWAVTTADVYYCRWEAFVST
jgi:hypothetical protein